MAYIQRGMRDRRRILLFSGAVATLVALLAGCGAGPRANPGTPTRVSQCAAHTLRLSLQTQGTATQSVVFLALTNTSQSVCRASGKAEFTIEQNGQPAKIRDNPLSLPVHSRLLAGQKKTVFNDVWWRNWCGSRRKIDLAIRFEGSVARSPFSVLPVCLDRKSPSRLIKGPAR